MEWIPYALTIIICLVSGVTATNNSDVIGIAVAGCISFVLLSVVITVLIMACNWTRFFGGWMKQHGKVRMPRVYFQKKEEAKRKLISSSTMSAVPVANGNLAPQNVDRGDLEVMKRPTTATSNYNGHLANLTPTANGFQSAVPKQINKAQNTTTSVQGWRQRNTGFTNRIYEEKDAVLELGDEVDDEFKIEAEVVDNEVLDVGPFKGDHSKEVPIQGNVYPDPYIYTTVDSSKQNKTGANGSLKPGPSVATSSRIAQDTKPRDSDYSTVYEAKKNFEESLLYL